MIQEIEQRSELLIHVCNLLLIWRNAVHAVLYIWMMRIEEMQPEEVRRATRALQTHAFWASLLSRMAPVGNFTAMNMLAGSMRVPFVPFLVGSAVGAAPGALLISLFADQAREWLRGSAASPGPKLAAGFALLVVLVFAARKLRRKRPTP